MKDTTHSLYRLTLIGAALAASLAASAGAQAWEVFATSRNVAGAEILMTNAPCKGGGFTLLSLAQPGGQAIRGCWDPLPGRVYVRWDDGDVSVFDYAGFTATDWGQEQIERIASRKRGAPARQAPAGVTPKAAPRAQFAVRRTP